MDLVRETLTKSIRNSISIADHAATRVIDFGFNKRQEFTVGKAIEPLVFASCSLLYRPRPLFAEGAVHLIEYCFLLRRHLAGEA
jgi:hypothetical protein